jgi:beclin 1
MYCQKCRAPLKLDSSLEHLNPAAFDLLIGIVANPVDTEHVLMGEGFQ